MSGPHLDVPSGDSWLAILAVAVLAVLISWLLLANAVQPEDVRFVPATSPSGVPLEVTAP